MSMREELNHALLALRETIIRFDKQLEELESIVDHHFGSQTVPVQKLMRAPEAMAAIEKVISEGKR